MTKILPCSCESGDQDRLYGKGRRVHNLCVMPKERTITGYRCTGCGLKKLEGDRSAKLAKGEGRVKQTKGAAQYPVWPKEIRKTKNGKRCGKCGQLRRMDRKNKRFVHSSCRQRVQQSKGLV